MGLPGQYWAHRMYHAVEHLQDARLSAAVLLAWLLGVAVGVVLVMLVSSIRGRQREPAAACKSLSAIQEQPNAGIDVLSSEDDWCVLHVAPCRFIVWARSRSIGDCCIPRMLFCVIHIPGPVCWHAHADCLDVRCARPVIRSAGRRLQPDLGCCKPRISLRWLPLRS